MFRRLFAFVALAFLTTTPAAAEPQLYRLDPAHTNLLWFASHMGFSKVSGKFAKVSGRFMLDEETPENSRVNVTVKTDSLLTGLPKFDTHLKSRAFFNASRYPEASFESTGVKRTGEKTATIHGELTLLGKTRPLTLEAEVNKIGKNPHTGKTTAGFSLTGTMDRTTWGMDAYVPAIPADVDLKIETEGVRAHSSQDKD